MSSTVVHPPVRDLCVCVVSRQARAGTTSEDITARAWTRWSCRDVHSAVHRENQGDTGGALAPRHWSHWLVMPPQGKGARAAPSLVTREVCESPKGRRNMLLTVLCVRIRRGAHGRTCKEKREKRSEVFRGDGPAATSEFRLGTGRQRERLTPPLFS